MIKRYIENNVRQDLKDKMVFIYGPRQVGKTTFAEQIGKKFYPDNFLYLNWDNRNDRKNIISSTFKADTKLIIFDEIHKYSDWKNYLKGEYDKNKNKYHYIVTGSARLVIYQKGGDSLLGRYFHHRLHPLSIPELMNISCIYKPFDELTFFNKNKESCEILDSLLLFGGFPEIYLKQNEKALRRWHADRVDILVREDIRDIENLRNISLLQVLIELMPDKVGSLFSINSLQHDLNVTHKTIASWVDILEKFYYHFRIYPFKFQKIKSLRKEPKLYLWDWSELDDQNAKFENMVASHLLKFCHHLYDSEGYKAELFFLRDIEKREVDFLVALNRKPWFCVEIKASYKTIPANLKYFKSKLEIPYSFLVTREKGNDFIKDDIRIISANKFLTALI